MKVHNETDIVHRIILNNDDYIPHTKNLSLRLVKSKSRDER